MIDPDRISAIRRLYPTNPDVNWLMDELLITSGQFACAMSVVTALGPVLDLWACDHVPRLGVEVDPECARCTTMGPLREAYRTFVIEAAPDEVVECPRSQRAGLVHSWEFDGDDPYVSCCYCGEKRDAISGVLIRHGQREQPAGSTALPDPAFIARTARSPENDESPATAHRAPV